MNLAWDCVRMKQQCSLLMQLEMNSFVQENTCIQNPWIVHAVPMKHTSAITGSHWDKPESQYKCVENVYQLCCVYACEYVYVFGWFIKDTSWMNESHTRGWLQAKWTTRKMCVFCQRESIVDLALNLISRRHAYKLMTNKELSEYDRIWIWLSCNKIWQKKWSLYLET